jgi:hypothetical protein
MWPAASRRTSPVRGSARRRALRSERGAGPRAAIREGGARRVRVDEGVGRQESGLPGWGGTKGQYIAFLLPVSVIGRDGARTARIP